LPETNKASIVEILAISKTLLVFDSDYARVNIPLNINKIDDKREWYYLKNTKDENVISILLSIYYDIKDKRESLCDNTFLGKSGFNIKNDLSCDVIKKTSNTYMKYMNKTNSSINDKSKIENLNNSHHSPNRYIKKSSGKNLDKTVMYIDNYKSPDMSLLGGSIFSPPSYRLDHDRSNIRKADDFLTTIESGMDNKISEFVTGDSAIVIKKIQYNGKEAEELVREKESKYS
jgi:hypothetical protein